MIKTSLFLLLTLFLIVSCQRLHSSSSTDSDSGEEEEISSEDSVSQATAIFWIDKSKRKYCDDPSIRTVKAKVVIHNNGKVDFDSFEKKQSVHVERYIRHNLSHFHVTKILMDSGYIKPGEQYVQLRYLPGLMGQAN